jgi:hypothetical protein
MAGREVTAKRGCAYTPLADSRTAAAPDTAVLIESVFASYFEATMAAIGRRGMPKSRRSKGTLRRERPRLR